MSKKLFIITVSVVLVLFLISLIGYYFMITRNSDTSSENPSGFSFFPFGSNDDSTPTSSGEAGTEANKPSAQNYTAKLRKISATPVAGAGVLDVKAGTIIRHIEKATGHIYETELFSPNQNRISNTTIPTVYDAIWGNKNLSLIARYLKENDYTVDTYSLTIKEVSTTTENTISGITFPSNISDVSIFGSTVFYLEQKQDSSIGYTSDFSGKNRRQIWNSPIKELLPQFVNGRTVALTTKPEQNIPGFLYFVDTSSGGIRKILGNINGLSSLTSPDAGQVLYLTEESDAILSIYNIKAKSARTLTPITFPEKCVWSKKDLNVIYCAVPRESLGGNSLISWYKGLVSFSDDIWKYDIKNNTADIAENLSAESGEPIDVVKLLLSDSEQYLVFINKRDNTLWSLDLSK